MTYSLLIDDAIAIAESYGNEVNNISTGWDRVREVVTMSLPMSDQLRALLSEKDSLRFWSSEPTPHNHAEEGFTDDNEKVSISFPA